MATEVTAKVHVPGNEHLIRATKMEWFPCHNIPTKGSQRKMNEPYAGGGGGGVGISKPALFINANAYLRRVIPTTTSAAVLFPSSLFTSFDCRLPF